MNLNSIFCMSGCGYLQEIIQQHGKFVARIKVLTQPDMRTLSNDEVWIDMEVTDAYQQLLLTELLGATHSGHSVIVMFKAEYKAFLNAASGLAPEDPNHIIALRAKLRLIEESYIDGQIARTNTPLLWTVG